MYTKEQIKAAKSLKSSKTKNILSTLHMIKTGFYIPNCQSYSNTQLIKELFN